MLIIQNDPAGVTGRQRFDWDHGVSLQENIERHLSGGGDCEITINGCAVNPLRDPRMDMPPSVMDCVVVSRRPAGVEEIGYIIVALLAAAVAYAMMPSLPGSNVGKESPNNSLTAQTNVARAYQAIPDVYGYRRCWPDLIQPSTVEYIDHVKYVTEWLCISRGEGTISEVQYAETPITDIDGASYEVFEPAAGPGYPEGRSTTILDVQETFASDEVNGQEISPAIPFPAVTGAATLSATASSTSFTLQLTDGPDLANLKSVSPSGLASVTFSYGAGPTVFDETVTVDAFVVASGFCTFTFTGTAWGTTEAGAVTALSITPTGSTATVVGPFTLPVNCERIRWNTVFLRGLKGSVTIRAEWWKVNGSGVEIGGTRQHQDETFTADTYDQRFWTTQVTPSGGSGRYRVQFTRSTPEIDDGGADVAKLEEVYAVRHYAEKVLPGVTVIRVTTKATTEATGFSDRKFNVRWLRHVRELYSDTLSSSRNFARAMLHIWTIAGNDATGIDVDALAAINTEFGESSELLRFDSSLDDADASLGERMQLAANTARCVVWRDGAKWTVTRDQARPYPELQLDYRNLAAGGDSAISYAAHLPASNDGVEVEYVDEASQSKKAYVRLNISTGAPVVGVSRNPKKIKMTGCATLAQADNRAQLEARRLIYQRTSVSDTALSDGSILGLGSLVRWVDPNDFLGDDGLQAGEVLSISGAFITTSEPLDWKGQGSGRIVFTGADGHQLGAPVICWPSSAGAELDTVPAGLYVADPSRQLGSRYSFAVGLTAAELEAAGLYTVTEIKPAADGTASLSLAQYDERIYEADA